MKIQVSVARQSLTLLDDDGRGAAPNTASPRGKAGVGEVFGSFQTPRGRHLIRAKIGAGAAAEHRSSCAAGRPGKSWSPAFEQQHPGRDWILTRILWLSGCEPGGTGLAASIPCAATSTSTARLITSRWGRRGRIGCIRMRNTDIVELFDLVPAYTPVEISED